MKEPQVYARLVCEIRQSFKHESEIVAENVDKLEYLNAVIEEG